MCITCELCTGQWARKRAYNVEGGAAVRKLRKRHAVKLASTMEKQDGRKTVWKFQMPGWYEQYCFTVMYSLYALNASFFHQIFHSNSESHLFVIPTRLRYTRDIRHTYFVPWSSLVLRERLKSITKTRLPTMLPFLLGWKPCFTFIRGTTLQNHRAFFLQISITDDVTWLK